MGTYTLTDESVCTIAALLKARKEQLEENIEIEGKDGQPEIWTPQLERITAALAELGVL